MYSASSLGVFERPGPDGSPHPLTSHSLVVLPTLRRNRFCVSVQPVHHHLGIPDGRHERRRRQHADPRNLRQPPACRRLPRHARELRIEHRHPRAAHRTSPPARRGVSTRRPVPAAARGPRPALVLRILQSIRQPAQQGALAARDSMSYCSGKPRIWLPWAVPLSTAVRDARGEFAARAPVPPASPARTASTAAPTPPRSRPRR